jgi:hypothetical protein
VCNEYETFTAAIGSLCGEVMEADVAKATELAQLCHYHEYMWDAAGTTTEARLVSSSAGGARWIGTAVATSAFIVGGSIVVGVGSQSAETISVLRSMLDATTLVRSLENGTGGAGGHPDPFVIMLLSAPLAFSHPVFGVVKGFDPIPDRAAGCRHHYPRSADRRRQPHRGPRPPQRPITGQAAAGAPAAAVR